jgi:nickel transport protein
MQKLLACLAVFSFVANALTAGAASAHAIWFAERSKRLAMIYGMGADDLDMSQRQSMVQSVHGYDADWKPVATQLQQEGPLMVVHSETAPAAVTAVFWNGIWSKPPGDGDWEKKSRLEMPNAIVSENNFKYAVYLKGASRAPVPLFPDQVLQIVPQSPVPLVKGAPLKLRVLFRGKPMANVKVITDFVNDIDAKPAKTGPDGRVTIRVRNQGLNVVNAVYDGPSDEPQKYDQVEYEATLTFVLPHMPE